MAIDLNAKAVVAKEGNSIMIYEDGYLNEHKDIPALTLLRWKKNI